MNRLVWGGGFGRNGWFVQENIRGAYNEGFFNGLMSASPKPTHKSLWFGRTRCWKAIADSHTPASGRNEDFKLYVSNLNGNGNSLLLPFLLRLPSQTVVILYFVKIFIVKVVSHGSNARPGVRNRRKSSFVRRSIQCYEMKSCFFLFSAVILMCVAVGTWL